MINYDCIRDKENDTENNLFPGIFRCLIIGPSGCGKTNLLLNLILNRKMEGLTFDKLYIYSKTIHQSKYKFLIELINDIENELEVEILKCFENENEIIPPNELDSSLKHLIVFDDCLLDKQNLIEAYFSQGRNNNVSCFYLCQSYTRIRKQIIRDNANVIILFPINNLNMKHVFDNHVFFMLPTFDVFKSLFNNVEKRET